MKAWILVAGIAVAGPAAARVTAHGEVVPDDERVRLGVAVDHWHEIVSDFSLDGEGRSFGVDGLGRTRVRAGGSWPLQGAALRLDVEADLFARRVYGDVPAVGTDLIESEIREQARFEPTPVVPRALSLTWRVPVGVLRVGHQTSHWGLGILANSGARDDRLFGDAFRASLVERVLFATAPARAFGAAPDSLAGRLTVAVAGDLVYADESARLFEEDDFPTVRDTAWQGVFSAFVRPRRWDGPPVGARHDASGGVYVVRRGQDYANGDRLDAWVIDGHARYVQEWGRTNRIRYELEGAWITGETDRLVTELGPRGVDVNALGLAFEMEWAWRLGGVPFGLTGLAGLASGDGDPDDDTLERFTFHEGYDAGLVLFEHVVPPLQRRAVERVDDPLRSKDPPRGVEGLAGRGGLSGASYGGLRLTAGPWRGFDGGVQVISASTSGPFTDPYRSFARGGEPTNPFGGPGEGHLGTEVDVVARYTLRDLGRPGLSPSLRLTYGVFLPGEVLEGPDGGLGTVHLFQARLAIDYDLEGGT